MILVSLAVYVLSISTMVLSMENGWKDLCIYCQHYEGDYFYLMPFTDDM